MGNCGDRAMSEAMTKETATAGKYILCPKSALNLKHSPFPDAAFLKSDLRYSLCECVARQIMDDDAVPL
eukprot:3457078-Pyramimonas_sp.AAC.1